VPYRRDSGSQGASADRGPTGVSSALDGRLAQSAFRFRDGAGATVNDQRRTGQLCLAVSLRLALRPFVAALGETPFRDPSVEGEEHAPTGAGPLGVTPLSKTALRTGPPVVAASALRSTRGCVHHPLLGR